MDKILDLVCPVCKAKKSRITTNKKGISRCQACGHEAPRKEFEKV